MKNIHDDIERVLFTSEELVKRAEEIGQQITEDYKGEEVTVIGILKGSFMFLSDVLKNVDLYTKLDFVTVQSYGNGTTSGELRLTKDISADIKGKHVILVEDMREYLDKNGTAFLGTNCADCTTVPVLIKLIDAKQDLSIQVHPDDDYAMRVEGEAGKTEMWYIVDAAPHAALYYGYL